MGYGDVDSPFVVSEPLVHEVPKPKPREPIPVAYLEVSGLFNPTGIMDGRDVIRDRIICKNCGGYVTREFCTCGFPRSRSVR
jgi:hypothetical protein